MPSRSVSFPVLALDMRDFDTFVNLFVDDVGVPGKLRGRTALKRWYADTMRPIPGSFHGVAGHVIDIESDATASGVVYSRNDLDLGLSTSIGCSS